MHEHWLNDWEKENVIRELVQHGLIKWSHEFDIPLKNGEFTDVFVDLRKARDYPDMLAYIAGVFAIPMQRLDPDRFLEIPHAVSCFAPHIAEYTGKPYTTVREVRKEGRAHHSRHVGSFPQGQNVVILDGVITDGISKTDALELCAERHASVQGVIVLVDRREGVEVCLSDEVPVWAGMSLHDIRAYLIKHGYMERCASERERVNPLIVSLDGRPWEDALSIAARLRPSGCIFKVNHLLFGKGYEEAISALQVYGRAMADLKMFDTPNTVHTVCTGIAPYEPWAVTVHASGGESMIRAAQEGLKGTSTRVVAVTVPSSMEDGETDKVYRSLSREQSLRLAHIAHQSGADGLVCGAAEVKPLRNQFPRMMIIPAGVRPHEGPCGDHRNVGTPYDVLNKGARYVIIGRPIMEAPAPAVEAHNIMRHHMEIDA